MSWHQFPVQEGWLDLGETAARTDTSFICLHDWRGASQNSSAQPAVTLEPSKSGPGENRWASAWAAFDLCLCTHADARVLSIMCEPVRVELKQMLTGFLLCLTVHICPDWPKDRKNRSFLPITEPSKELSAGEPTYLPWLGGYRN